MKDGVNESVALERKLSSLNVWSLAFGSIIGWGAFVMPANTFLVKAGPLGTAIAMGIASLIMIVIAFNYDHMINRYPLAGGEFAYAERVFGRKHAFVCSWFLGLSYLAIIPLNATALALIGRNLMNNIFQMGFHYSVAGYDIYFGEIVLAVAALVIFACMSIRGVKIAAGIQNALVFMLIGGVLIVTIAAIVSPDVKFSDIAPAFNPDTTAVGGVLAVVAVAPWAFVGFDTVPQLAEEISFSRKKTRWIMVLSIMFGGLVYILLNTVTAAVVPAEYADWTEYLAALDSLEGIKALPTFNAAYQMMGSAGLLLLGIAVLGAVLSGIVGFYMATSRLMYSMAKEQVLPGWFAVLHKKYKTPVNAILFIMAISLIAPFFGRTALGWIVDMSSIGAAIGYGYTSLAACVCAKKEGNRLITATGALGTLFALCFVVLLLVPVPMFNCSLGRESWICLLVWIALGAVFKRISGRKI